jgi:type I restriction enzyme, S subunit
MFKKTLKPYQKYRDSGVEWFAELPENWKVRKLKHVCQLKYGNSLEANKRQKGKIPVYGSNGIVDFHNQAITKSPCIIIGRKGSFGKINFSKTECFPIDTTYYIDEIDTELYSLKWLMFFLAVSKLDGVSKDTGVPGLNREDAYRKKFPIPPIETQNRIAKYLNHKTKQADTFIEKQTRLIELLKEQKKAIINKAVTKGLNPDAPMKDSGIEWLGEIPAHWEVRKLKFISKIVLGKMLCSNDLGGYHYKHYLKSKNIGWINVIAANIDKMWFSNYELNLYKVEEGDLLLSEGGEVGKTCIWRSEIEECYIQNSVHKVTIEKNNYNRFYLYFFFSIGHTGVFKAIVNQVSIAHLTREKLKEVVCAVPTASEQHQIVSHIETQTVKIDRTIQKAEKEITLVKEYLQSIIYHVVIGKLEIKD